MIDYNQQYETYVQAIEARLVANCERLFYEDSNVANAAKYSLLNGGKRIRGVLTLDVCQMLCGDYTRALDFACAIELIHCYSLIHDDLPCMDDDAMRRGKPSCHIAFAEDTALLAGDALLTAAFELACTASLPPSQSVKAIKCLSEMAGAKGMIYGQELDLYYESRHANKKQLVEIYNNKTGCLINAAVLLGAIACNASDTDCQRLSSYAYDIGLSFQIADDILDVISTQEQLGKPIGSDNTNQKSTFVSLYNIEKAKAEIDIITKRACNNISSFKNSDFLIYFALQLSIRKK